MRSECGESGEVLVIMHCHFKETEKRIITGFLLLSGQLVLISFDVESHFVAQMALNLFSSCLGLIVPEISGTNPYLQY